MIFINAPLAIQIIDSYFKDLEKEYRHIIATDTCIGQVIIHCGSTKRTWADKDFAEITLVLFPLNLSGGHWTLLVIDLFFLLYHFALQYNYAIFQIVASYICAIGSLDESVLICIYICVFSLGF